MSAWQAGRRSAIATVEPNGWEQAPLPRTGGAPSALAQSHNKRGWMSTPANGSARFPTTCSARDPHGAYRVRSPRIEITSALWLPDAWHVNVRICQSTALSLFIRLREIGNFTDCRSVGVEFRLCTLGGRRANPRGS